jgi:nitrogen fixation protein FixH
MAKENKNLQLKEEQLRLTDDGRVVIDDPEIYEALRQAQTNPVDEEGLSVNFKCHVSG